MLEWERCDDKLCATATAPLDWSDPAAGEIELALVRRPASGQKIGSLLVNPGHVVSRRALLAALPSGQAGSEHAVEMAVARLRAAIGTKAVVTVVKRGYRLAVG